jgi:D-beta-D-heptose 7-phosphate kinase/D-beta-D-heptose 1-phosphate adenosyltransferase
MNRTRYLNIASRFPALKLLVVGDIMLDEFVWGRVKRISPEAPVPVVQVDKETSYPGGAANVARNLPEFCGEVHLLGLIGTNLHAVQLKGLLAAENIRLDCLVEDPAYQTIVKTRIIARAATTTSSANQQVVRVDREKKIGLTRLQTAQALQQLGDLIEQIDGIIIEDYAKGLLDQELVDAIVTKAREAGKIVTVDPNPNNRLSWNNVTTIKPNRSEAFASAGWPQSDPVEPPTADTALLKVGEILMERWNSASLLVTLSDHGIMLFQRDAPPFHIPTRAQEVYDVSGAGDTTIALYTLALCAGATATEAAVIANNAAGVVVGKLGTATLTPAELLATFEADEIS